MEKRPVTVHSLIDDAVIQDLFSVYLNSGKDEQMNSTIIYSFTSSETENTGIAENIFSSQAEKKIMMYTRLYMFSRILDIIKTDIRKCYSLEKKNYSEPS